MMQRANGIEIDKECDEIKNGIYSLVAFAVYCQLTLMRGIIGEKLIAAASKESQRLQTNRVKNRTKALWPWQTESINKSKLYII